MTLESLPDFCGECGAYWECEHKHVFISAGKPFVEWEDGGVLESYEAERERIWQEEVDRSLSQRGRLFQQAVELALDHLTPYPDADDPPDEIDPVFSNSAAPWAVDDPPGSFEAFTESVIDGRIAFPEDQPNLREALDGFWSEDAPPHA